MNLAKFDKLSKKDFQNGAILDEIRTALKKSPYQPPLKITGVLLRQAAKNLVLAWVNESIEIYECDRQTVTQYFDPDDFGNLFKSLEWQDVKRVKVTIEPEFKE